MSESRIQGWLSDGVELVSTMTVDIHEVSIFRFDGEDLLYGVLDRPNSIVCLYGRDEKELRQAFKAAMGIEVSGVTVAPETYCLVYALIALVLIIQGFSPDKAPVILFSSAAALLLAATMNLSLWTPARDH